MKSRQARTLICVGTLVVIATAGLLVAGPLDPPAGPIAPTYKTLTEVEPRIAINATNTPGDSSCVFRITVPGSYYLTSNLVGVSGKYGISVATNNVTIDLNGFLVVGVTDSRSGIYGDITQPAREGVVVTNGTVRNWGSHGIDLGRNARVTAVQAHNNGLCGIRVYQGSIITACTAAGNDSDGFQLNRQVGALGTCIVTACVSYDNAGNGLTATTDCTVARFASTLDDGRGVEIEHGSISDSVVQDSGGVGIDLWVGTVSGCAVDGSGLEGILVFDTSTVSGCSVLNSTIGIAAGKECTITDCSVSLCSAAGISVGNGSSVIDCNSGRNTGDGILASNACQVRGNTCHDNGELGSGAGINLTGTSNRVEGNVCISADYGIFAGSTSNLFLRNTCRANTTNWNVAAGNFLLVVNPPASAAVVGNTGGSSVGADPNANYSY